MIHFNDTYHDIWYSLTYTMTNMRTPQTEEIRLTTITTTRISKKFLQESQYIFNTCSQESPDFHASFHVCKRSLRHSKNLSRKSLDLEIQIFYKYDLLREWHTITKES